MQKLKTTETKKKTKGYIKNKGWSTFLIPVFVTLVTQNHNSAFNKVFYLS